MFHPVDSEVTEKEKRWTYQLSIVFNDKKIIRVTITDYYQQKHPEITNELIMELLNEMNGEELKPTKYDGERKPYLWEKDYNNKRYRLIFWFKDDTDNHLWIRNCFQRNKKTCKMKNSIEAKITELLRKEKEHLKKHLLSWQQCFPWISLIEKNNELSKEFSVYGWIDKQEEIDLLNNEEKLKEIVKKKIPEFVQGIVSGLRFQLIPKICQKKYYDTSNLIIKNKVDFYKLDYSDLISLFKKIDLPRNKRWVCFLPIELFKLAEDKKEHFELKPNLLNIIPLPLGNSLQIVFAETFSPLLTYCIDDIFCQENYKNMGKNRLFTVAKTLYKIEEVKGKLIGIANAKPIEFPLPSLGKCQTCKKPLLKEKAMGAKRVEFSDSWYYFCSLECHRSYDYWEAMERGENSEEYLKKELKKQILTQQAIRELEEEGNVMVKNNQESKDNEYTDKICRRCSNYIEKIKNCGKENCPWYTHGGNYIQSIKKEFGIELPNKCLIDNLCNACSKKFEDVLAAFYNCKIGSKSAMELEKEQSNQLFDYKINIETGNKITYETNAKTQVIKIWEKGNAKEFDLKKHSLDFILESMGF